MDYYYALLNSYDLLKKRKFKLSLREQEKGSATQEVSPEAIEQAADEAEAALKKAAEQLPQETAVETNLGVNRDISLFVDGTGTQSGDKDAMHRTVRVGGVEGAYGSTIKFKATEIEKIKWTKKNTNGYKLARAWAGAGGGTEIDYKKDDSDNKTGKYIGSDTLKQKAEIERELLRSARISAERLARLGLELAGKSSDEVEAVVDSLETKVDTTLERTDITAQEIIDTLTAVTALLEIGKKIKSSRGDYTAKDEDGKPKVEGLLKLGELFKDLKTKHNISISEEDGTVTFGKLKLTLDANSDLGEFVRENADLVKELAVLYSDTLGVAAAMSAINPVRSEPPPDKEAVRGVAIENLELLGLDCVESFACMDILTAKEGETKDPEYLECLEFQKECYDKFTTGVVEAIKVREDFDKRRAECEKMPVDNLQQRLAKVKCVDEVDRLSRGNKAIGVSFGELVNIFRTGLLVEGDYVLVSEEGELNQKTVNWVKKDLMESRGWTEEQALYVIRQIAGVDEKTGEIIHDGNGLQILFLMATASRKMTEAIHGDMKPSVVIPMGQGQGDRPANVIGAKVDVESAYCPGVGRYKGKSEENMVQDLTDHIRDNLLSEEQIDYYTKGCPGEDEKTKEEKKDAIDKIIKDDLIGEPEQILDPILKDEDGKPKVVCEKGYRIARDPKTHKSIKEESTFGEMSADVQNGVFDYLCNSEVSTINATGPQLTGKKKDVRDAAQLERLKQIKDIASSICGKDAISGACKFFNEVKEETAKIDAVLTPGADIEVPGGQEGFLDEWERLQQDKDKDKEGAKIRSAAALRCLKGKSYPKENWVSWKPGKSKPKSDCEHLKSIQNGLKSNAQSKVLDKYTDKKTGEVSGAGLRYYQTMYLAIGGSDREIIQDKRGIGDNTQETMLRNAEFKQNLRTAKFVRAQGRGPKKEGEKKWSMTVNVQDSVDSKKRRAHIAPDRDTLKVRSGSDPAIYRIIGDEDTQEEKDRTGGSRPKEELLMSFFKGQQALLEKLINRTT